MMVLINSNINLLVNEIEASTTSGKLSMLLSYKLL